MMRSACFVDRLELEFSGNHFSHAVTIADVDNDGFNELLIGNVDGVLAIFKGAESSKPWKKCSGLGTVTCVGVGDVLNSGTNATVVINAEAQCYLFIIDNSSSIPQSPLALPTSPPTISRSMKPHHVQTLELPNANVLCIAQIGEGKRWDLFVGHTDRCVAVYHWSQETKKLEMMKKFSLSGQIGSLSVGQSSCGTPQVLVSQPGGTYMPIACRPRQPREAGPKAAVGEELRDAKTAEMEYMKQLSERLWLGEMVGQAQRRNPSSSTEVVGQILYQSDALAADSCVRSDAVALCTLDGVVRLLKSEQKQWELQVDHSLFTIGKLDVTGNGEDAVVVCAWDGTTYIVDHNRNCVRFWFDQNVSTFCCGYYGNGGKNLPCLVYTTFTNLIYLYKDVTLTTIPAANLLLTLQNMPIAEQLQEKLLSMNSEEKQKLFQQCLYGYEEQNRRSRVDTNNEPSEQS